MLCAIDRYTKFLFYGVETNKPWMHLLLIIGLNNKCDWLIVVHYQTNALDRTFVLNNADNYCTVAYFARSKH